jgi:hypothetical protein
MKQNDNQVWLQHALHHEEVRKTGDSSTEVRLRPAMRVIVLFQCASWTV